MCQILYATFFISLPCNCCTINLWRRRCHNCHTSTKNMKVGIFFGHSEFWLLIFIYSARATKISKLFLTIEFEDFFKFCGPLRIHELKLDFPCLVDFLNLNLCFHNSHIHQSTIRITDPSSLNPFYFSTCSTPCIKCGARAVACAKTSLKIASCHGTLDNKEKVGSSLEVGSFARAFVVILHPNDWIISHH